MLDNLKEFDIVNYHNIGYIYYLYYKDILVYIGKTTELVARLKAHKKDKLFDKVLYSKVILKDIDLIEREQIRLHFPIYNMDHVSITDYSNNKCDLATKIEEYWIIRGYKHYHESSVYIKDNILLIQLSRPKQYFRYMYVDLTKKNIDAKYSIIESINQSWYDIHSIAYDEITHSFVIVEV